MKNIFAALHDNLKVARIGIEEAGSCLAYHDLDAAQLSTLISEMSKVRAKMADKFTMPDPGGLIFRDVTRKARYIIGREHVTAKEVYAAFLHEGYGWLAFTLEEKPAAAMVLMMSRNVAGMKPRIVRPPKPPSIIT